MAENNQANYHLELTRGATFYPALFDEQTFGASHQHCVSCGKTIAPPGTPGAESQAYVTVRAVRSPDGRSGVDFRWICQDCFANLREKLDWKLEPNLPELPTVSSNWALRPPRSEADVEKLAREHPFALVGWAPEEVVSIAGSIGRVLSLDQAISILRNDERRIEGAMTAAGHALLMEILKAL